jgi:spore coat protein U-like protein
MMVHRLLIVLLLVRSHGRADDRARAELQRRSHGRRLRCLRSDVRRAARCNGSVQVECIAQQIPWKSGSTRATTPRQQRRQSAHGLGAFNLPYNLYTDAARGIVWATATPRRSVAPPASPAACVRIQRGVRHLPARDAAHLRPHPDAQDVGVGSYSDQVDVTIIF